MTDRIDRAGLLVATSPATFMETQVLPGTGIAAHAFRTGTADIPARFAPQAAG